MSTICSSRPFLTPTTFLLRRRVTVMQTQNNVLQFPITTFRAKLQVRRSKVHPVVMQTQNNVLQLRAKLQVRRSKVHPVQAIAGPSEQGSSDVEPKKEGESKMQKLLKKMEEEAIPAKAVMFLSVVAGIVWFINLPESIRQQIVENLDLLFGKKAPLVMLLAFVASVLQIFKTCMEIWVIWEKIAVLKKKKLDDENKIDEQ